MLQPTIVRLFVPGGCNLASFPTVEARNGLALVELASKVVLRGKLIVQRGFAIIHIPTGMRLGSMWPTVEAGREAFNDLTTLDWTTTDLKKWHFKAARRWGAKVDGSTKQAAARLWKMRLR